MSQSGQASGGSPPVRHRTLKWLALALLSALLIALMEAASLPAAFLIGPMIAAVAFGSAGAGIRLARPFFIGAQALIGCQIAAALSPDIFSVFAGSWPVFAGAVLLTVVASSLLGWLISRWRILPGTTAVWGSAPGASTAMVLMAGAFGADQRLVAFMQYLRVIAVSIGAALVARLFVDLSAVDLAEHDWFAPVEPKALAVTIVVAAVSAAAARLIRLPSPYFLGPFIVAGYLHLSGTIAFELPEWLLLASYVAIGWTIGLSFTGSILKVAARVLLQVLLAIAALMAFCGGIAWLLVHEFAIDPLTAYLATSPGGMDTIAIIAVAAPGVDISFVMTMQAIRFLVVLIVGPPVARVIARMVPPRT